MNGVLKAAGGLIVAVLIKNKIVVGGVGDVTFNVVAKEKMKMGIAVFVELTITKNVGKAKGLFLLNNRSNNIILS